MKTLHEYRCTRNYPYSIGCPGYKDLGARQGYYIVAASESEALAEMAARFPKETEAKTLLGGFTATKWKENVLP